MAQPSTARNPLSIAGAWLTTVGAFAFITFYIFEEFGLIASPYGGLFGFVAAPAVFVFGLLLIPIGIWREARRRAHGRAPWSWPLIDLGRSRTRQVVIAVAALTIVNLAIVAVAGTSAMHYMETDQFCGQVCHTTMQPEFEAHHTAPHASVKCVQCHVAPGAAGTVRAKMNGTRQLYLMMTGGYSRPIPTPAHGVPVAAETCWHCHSPGFPDRDITVIKREYANDETSTESVTTLVMHTARIHWHARPDTRVEFIAADPKRDTIPYVKLTDRNGHVTEFFADGTAAVPAGELRRMDCLDCHTRPAHRFSASPEEAVDRAIAAAHVDRALPFVRREMVAALKEASGAAGADPAMGRLTAFYRASDAALQPKVTQVVETTQRLYRANVFPHMRVTWGTYRTQLSHTEPLGCFRCHDDNHKARDGRVIKQDCEICHEVK
jgi:hypothetical protein